MRFLKEYIFVCAVSLLLASCGEEITNTIISENNKRGIGVNISAADYYLKTIHKSYYNKNYTDNDLTSDRNFYRGLKLILKLDEPSKREVINRLVLLAEGDDYPIGYDFNKTQLSTFYADSVGGYIIDLPVEELYGGVRNYNWKAALYDANNKPSNDYLFSTKSYCILYKTDFENHWLGADELVVRFDKPSASVTSKDLIINLYDSSKVILKDYRFAALSLQADSVMLNDVSTGSFYFTAEFNEVYEGIKRSYRSGYLKIENPPLIDIN